MSNHNGGSALAQEADRQLRTLAARRAALDVEEARWLIVARDEKVHETFGFGSFVEYCERALGYRPHTTRERLRVATALSTLPEITRALAANELSYSAVRELTRVVDTSTEQAWLDAARGRTIGEIESLVAGHTQGDLPDGPADPDLEPRVLRLELTPEAYAMFLEARRTLEDETGEKLDDSALITALGERACRGTTSTRAPFQIALTVCARCDRAMQDAAGRTIDVPPPVLERARCDADHIGSLDAANPERLTSDIPPATRRLVHRRDHDRCTVPGCRSARFLDIHHLIEREHGGTHELSNLTLLCDAHHRAVHEGRLTIRGRAPDALAFAHANGQAYGSVDHTEDATIALRGLGFSPAIARAAVTRAASQLGRDVPIETFLRACLRECPRPGA